MLLTNILGGFPQTGVKLAFGYGSGVLEQANASGDNLTDLIIVVDNPVKWHQENLTKNYKHYSFLRYSSAETISRIQRRAARVYFNPYAIVDNVHLKYGVIAEEDLIQDLNDWSHLYVAGRLHKPVKFMTKSHDHLDSSLRFNRESALRAAMLQLPETFKPYELYRMITGLSYHGDIRMIFGENVRKIDNIVTKQVELFDEIYLPIIRSSSSIKWDSGKRLFIQDLSPKVVAKNLNLLPIEVRRKIFERYRKEACTIESDLALDSLSKNLKCGEVVAGAIETIIRRSTTSQTLKGLITAGLTRSLKYTRRKVTKYLVSRFV